MPHGLSNAILLPHVMQFNMVGSEGKFRDMAEAMGIRTAGLTDREAAEKMIEELYALIKDLNLMTSLQEKGISADDLDLLVSGAAKVTRLLDNNPRPMTKDDMREIYRKLL